jgi:hypothetical protein
MYPIINIGVMFTSARDSSEYVIDESCLSRNSKKAYCGKTPEKEGRCNAERIIVAYTYTRTVKNPCLTCVFVHYTIVSCGMTDVERLRHASGHSRALAGYLPAHWCEPRYLEQYAPSALAWLK